jgi:hypothetical protein
LEHNQNHTTTNQLFISTNTATSFSGRPLPIVKMSFNFNKLSEIENTMVQLEKRRVGEFNNIYFSIRESMKSKRQRMS